MLINSQAIAARRLEASGATETDQHSERFWMTQNACQRNPGTWASCMRVLETGCAVAANCPALTIGREGHCPISSCAVSRRSRDEPIMMKEEEGPLHAVSRNPQDTIRTCREAPDVGMVPPKPAPDPNGQPNGHNRPESGQPSKPCWETHLRICQTCMHRQEEERRLGGLGRAEWGRGSHSRAVSHSLLGPGEIDFGSIWRNHPDAGPRSQAQFQGGNVMGW
ncbi:hypothetical protein BDP81DRAFT_472657 [Colletotrichum phormii]|uniref:Uncharacterized protein n=1 Tax=Colletotrichum phormii TaxID=359342 RepID=A0AAJ0EFH2_9PEZI|nr:uncharacterized protein BDP81DRAFT_472657 [Colletotrichum phormii]KAK1635081.1 hypothetical protein BDP81DRAFT_472657 [Colletotrichum phormii]